MIGTFAGRRRIHWQLLFLALAGNLAGCDKAPEPPTKEEALQEIQKRYDDLVGDSLDKPIEWASGDFENIGDWDYQIIDIDYTTNEEFADQLNTLGDDRWEVIWIEAQRGGFKVVLKRPSVSYLSRIPFSQLGRLIPTGSGE